MNDNNNNLKIFVIFSLICFIFLGSVKVHAAASNPGTERIETKSFESSDLVPDEVIAAGLDSKFKGFKNADGSAPSYMFFDFKVAKNYSSYKPFEGLYLGVSKTAADVLAQVDYVGINYWDYGYYLFPKRFDFVLFYNKETKKFEEVNPKISDIWGTGNSRVAIDTRTGLPPSPIYHFAKAAVYSSNMIMVRDADGNYDTGYTRERFTRFEDIVFTQEKEPEAPSWSGLWDLLKHFFTAVFNSLFELLRDLIDSFANFFKFFKDLFAVNVSFSDLLGLFGSLFDGIKNALSVLFIPFSMLIDLLKALIASNPQTVINFGSVDFFGFVLPFYVDFSLLQGPELKPVLVALNMLNGAFLSYWIVMYLKKLYFKFFDDGGGES